MVNPVAMEPLRSQYTLNHRDGFKLGVLGSHFIPEKDHKTGLLGTTFQA